MDGQTWMDGHKWINRDEWTDLDGRTWMDGGPYERTDRQLTVVVKGVSKGEQG